MTLGLSWSACWGLCDMMLLQTFQPVTMLLSYERIASIGWMAWNKVMYKQAIDRYLIWSLINIGLIVDCSLTAPSHSLNRFCLIVNAPPTNRSSDSFICAQSMCHPLYHCLGKSPAQHLVQTTKTHHFMYKHERTLQWHNHKDVSYPHQINCLFKLHYRLTTGSATNLQITCPLAQESYCDW